MNICDGPEKMIGRPADGEGDGDGAEEASNAAATGEDVSGATTAYHAGCTVQSGAVSPQLADDHHERADDKRCRDGEQQREYSHAVRATRPVPRPILYTRPIHA